MRTLILILALAAAAAAQCPLTGKFGVKPQPAVLTGDVYDQIAALPTMIERKNFFATLSAQDKEKAWQRHWDTILGTYRLSFEQSSAIKAMKELTIVKFYVNRPPIPEQYMKMVKATFKKADTKAIFETLGPVTIEPQSEAPICSPCDCRGSVSWCDSCVVLEAPNACAVTEGGCGPGWLWNCTGCCMDMSIE